MLFLSDNFLLQFLKYELVKGYVDHIDVYLGVDIIARHVRRYSQEAFIYSPFTT